MVDKQPGFEHGIVHNVAVIVETVKFEMIKHGRPFKEKFCGLGSFFVVRNVKRCNWCGTSILQQTTLVILAYLVYGDRSPR